MTIIHGDVVEIKDLRPGIHLIGNVKATANFYRTVENTRWIVAKINTEHEHLYLMSRENYYEYGNGKPYNECLNVYGIQGYWMDFDEFEDCFDYDLSHSRDSAIKSLEKWDD